jgi:hypothetical protein
MSNINSLKAERERVMNVSIRAEVKRAIVGEKRESLFGSVRKSILF